MLQDPYPNPYFELNKRRIYIFKVKKRIKIKSKKFKDNYNIYLLKIVHKTKGQLCQNYFWKNYFIKMIYFK